MIRPKLLLETWMELLEKETGFHFFSISGGASVMPKVPSSSDPRERDGILFESRMWWHLPGP